MLKRLSFLTCLCFLGIRSVAADFTVDGIAYNITTTEENNPTVGVTYTSNPYTGDIVIPDSVTYNDIRYCVSSILESAFYDDGTLLSVKLPNTINSIGKKSFYSCKGLTSIEMSDSLQIIGDYAFYYCSALKEITIPVKCSQLGNYALESCTGLKSITVKNPTPPTLGSSPFNNISEYIYIYVPEGSAENYTAHDVWNDRIIINGDSPTAITVTTTAAGELGNEILKQVEYLDYINELTISGPLNSDDYYQIQSCTPNLVKIDMSATTMTTLPNNFFDGRKRLKEIILPQNITSIGNYALCNCQTLTGIIIPDGVATIGQYAFQNCYAMETVQFPKSLTTINQFAFYYCTSLKEVVLPEGLTTLGVGIFRECHNLTSCTLPKSLTYIGTSMFRECYKLNSIELHENITEIKNYAFYNCVALKSVVIPDNVVSILPYCFQSCDGLEEVSISDNVTVIPEYSFGYCPQLKSVKFPRNLKTIKDFAFRECISLTSLILPEGLHTLYDNSFYRCTGLTDISLPSTLYYSGMSFNYCSNVKSVTCYASCPPTDDENANILSNVDKTNTTLYVPQWSINEYKLAKGWNEFPMIEPIETDADIHVYANSSLQIDDNERPLHEPNVTVYPGGKFKVLGESTLSMSSYTQSQQFTLNSSNYTGTYSSMMNEASVMRADSVKVQLELSYNTSTAANRWTFFTLPFDCYIDDITVENGVRYAIRRYDGESRAAASGSANWKDMTSGMMLNAGEGYIVQLESNSTITFTAADNQNKNNLFSEANVSRPLNEHIAEFNHNSSWNFIGNPYQSFYDIRYMDFSAPVTYRNGNGYTAVSPLDDAYILHPMQGFFVQKPVDVDTLTFNYEGCQIGTDIRELEITTLAKTKNVSMRELFDLVLSNGDGDSDKTRIVLNQFMTLGYDMSRDASKFMSESGEASQLYTFDSTTRYAINERPLDNALVNLGFLAGKEGYYTISLNRATSDREVILIDNETGTETRLDLTGSYSFNAKSGYDDTRFTLSFNNSISGINGISDNQSSVTTSNGCIVVNTNAGNIITVYNLAGQIVASAEAATRETIINLNAGIYIVKAGNQIHKAIINK